MKISNKGLYAVRFMVYLAKCGGSVPVPLKEVSDAQGISKKYLEQIVPSLVSAKLVTSVRGASGGYRLGKSAARITVLDVLQVTEGSLAPASCLEGNELDCTMPAPCMELSVWKGLNRVVHEYLGGVSLQDIVDNDSSAAADNYSI